MIGTWLRRIHNVHLKSLHVQGIRSVLSVCPSIHGCGAHTYDKRATGVSDDRYREGPKAVLHIALRVILMLTIGTFGPDEDDE